ncbi:MAG: GNAT family N-acetyltransferase [Thalassotalea sp.]|nr:GNAT family N-acetyltransferase [Thalassotalea sp.]
MTTIVYREITERDFAQVIALANHVHGEGYMDMDNTPIWVNKGIKDGINAGFVALDGEKLVGFRLTYAVGNWEIDKWCSPELWQVSPQSVCYFKCNTVDENYRGYGIGSELLKRSIAAAQQQGAKAGVSHLWKQSPGNSAVKYFTKCGGKLIKSHPDKWREDALNGYDCILCGFDCHCEAAEMMIYFES